MLNQIGGELVDSNADSADLYLNQGLQLANVLLNDQSYHSEENRILLYKSQILSELGYVSYLNVEYKKAIQLLNESIDIKEDINDLSYKINFFNHLGYCYYKLGDYMTSLDYFYKSLDYNEDYHIYAYTYQAIGKNYTKLELYDKAIEAYSKSIELAGDNPDMMIIAGAKNGLGETYMLMRLWGKATKEVNTAKSILEVNEGANLEESYALMGRIKIEVNQLDSALHYLRLSERLCVKNNSKEQLINVYHYYSILYNIKSNTHEAIRFATKMHDLSIEKMDISNEKIAYELLYRIYEEDGNFEKAFEYFKLYNETKEELAIDETKNLLFKEEMKLENEQRSLRDSLQFNSYNIIKNNQIKSNEEDLKQAKKTRAILFSGLVVLLIALFGFIRSLVRKKKDNVIIIKQKQAVELQQGLLAEQNSKLQSKATLYKILQVCSSDNDIHGILKEVLDQLLKVDLIGKQQKGCILLIGDNERIRLEVEKGLIQDEINSINNISLDECLCGQVYISSKVEYCEPEHGENHFNIPIINNGEVQGIILLYSELSVAKMMEAEEFLNSIGILLGETIYRHKISDKLRIAHIENTIKKKEIQRAHVKVHFSLQKQEAINDLMGTIIRNENVGEKVYNYASEIFGNIFIRRLNITLFDFDREMIRFYFLRENGVEKLRNEEFPLSNFSKDTMESLKQNKRVIVQSVRDKEILSESDNQMLRNNINAFASFPLIIDGELLGSFNVSFEEKIEFTEEQEGFISMLIEGITIAIHQNLLFTEISSKNNQLSKLNKEIKASINYAKKLQQSVLPSVEHFDRIFPNKFVYLKQKDIVGGDFYWVNEINGLKFIAGIDCTGHGVPGAFMTMLSRVLLREAVNIKGLINPSEILTQVDGAIREIFRQSNYEAMQDGMDMSICVIDEASNKISFAAAQRPVVLKMKNKDKLLVIKGSKFPVGGYFELEKKYDLLEYKLDEVETFYLFSDGYVDQFGGPNIKKYGTKQFVKTLNVICEMPMHLQKEFLVNEVANWKGELDQIDDILVLGVRPND